MLRDGKHLVFLIGWQGTGKTVLAGVMVERLVAAGRRVLTFDAETVAHSSAFWLQGKAEDVDVLILEIDPALGDFSPGIATKLEGFFGKVSRFELPADLDMALALVDEIGARHAG